MYAVIRWIHENMVGVVSMNWLDRYKEVDGAWYPPDDIEQRTIRGDTPTAGWQHYHAKLYLSDISTFEKALKHANNIVDAVDSEKEQARIISLSEQSGSINSGGLIQQSLAVVNDTSSNFEHSGIFEQSTSATSNPNLSFGLENSGLFATNSPTSAPQDVTFNRVLDASYNPQATISTPTVQRDVIFNHVQDASYSSKATISTPTAQRDAILNHVQDTSYNTKAPRNKRPFTVMQKPEVSNELILKKVLLLQTDMKEVQSTMSRLCTMIQDTGEQSDQHNILSKMRSMEEFDKLELYLEDSAFQRKLHRFLIPYAVEGLCSRSIYAVLGFLGTPELWIHFSLRGQRDGKRRLDTTRLFLALKRFCSTSGFKYKSLDDAVSLYLKKFQPKKEKRPASTAEK